MADTGEERVAAARNTLRRGWQFLTRLNVAAVLIVTLLLLTALGSCFPQLSAPVAADAERLAHWEAGVRGRYGPLTGLLAAVGALRWFRSPVFLVSLTLLAIATLVCTLDRWRAVWRRAFHLPVGPVQLVLETAPHTARLTGLSAADLPRVVRERLESQGFRFRSDTAGDLLYLRGDRNRLASLATLATHLAVLLLILGAVLSSGYGWQEELSIEPDGTAEVGHGSQLTLRNEGFDIRRYPDGNVAAYQAQVAVIEDGQEVTHRNVGVNHPLAYGGVGFYLRGYGEIGDRYRVTLWAVRDPGYGLVIAAGFLLLLGLTVSFNFPRCWIQGCIEPGGTLHLAGWAERRTCDFEPEFRALVDDLSRRSETAQEETN